MVVTRLDRLGRSLPDLLGLVEDLAARDVGLRSLAEQIDTTSATGRLVLHVFGALAEFECALMHERTMAGLAAARARGRIGGRPKALTGARDRGDPGRGPVNGVQLAASKRRNLAIPLPMRTRRPWCLLHRGPLVRYWLL